MLSVVQLDKREINKKTKGKIIFIQSDIIMSMKTQSNN